MKTHARTLLLILAAIGLVASVAALYVHYQMLRDPAYTSFCDVTETVSCEAVLGSQYSSLFGIPVAVGGAIWSALVMLLAGFGMRRPAAVVPPAAAGTPTKAVRPVVPPSAALASDAAGYIFILSTLALAVVLYLGYASFFIVQKACPLCLAMYVSVIGAFLVSGAAASTPLSSLPFRVSQDLRAALASPLAAICAILWLALSVGLVAFFPRQPPQPEATVAAAAAPPPPTETFDDEQRAQFEKWIVAQPRVNIPITAGGAPVVVVKFNDYQCPACRQTYVQYKAVVEKYEREHGDRVKFVTMDFPLEAECNLGSIHAAACEAAAAVRMARAKGKGAEMEEWLFANQETMTPDGVKAGVREIAQVSDFDAQYPKTLEAVRADAKLGRDLGVDGTPTFFVNGIKVPSLRPMYFEALIAFELKRTEAAKPE